MRDAATMPKKETNGMDKKKYKEARDTVCRLIDSARLKEASVLVGGIMWREGEPEKVCTAGVEIPDMETASGMIALLLFSLLGQFEDAEDRLFALGAAEGFVRMLIERNPHARNFSELTDFGQGLPELHGSPVQ